MPYPVKMFFGSFCILKLEVYYDLLAWKKKVFEKFQDIMDY